MDQAWPGTDQARLVIQNCVRWRSRALSDQATKRFAQFNILLLEELKYKISVTPGPNSLRAIPDIARRRPGVAWSLRTYLRTTYEQSTNILFHVIHWQRRWLFFFPLRKKIHWQRRWLFYLTLVTLLCSDFVNIWYTYMANCAVNSETTLTLNEDYSHHPSTHKYSVNVKKEGV